MKTSRLRDTLLLALAVAVAFLGWHQSPDRSAAAQSAPDDAPPVYVPSANESTFFKVYQQSKRNLLEPVRRDYPIRLGFVSNLDVAWDAKRKGGTFNAPSQDWIVDSVGVGKSVSKKERLTILRDIRDAYQSLTDSKKACRVTPMVVPADIMGSSGEGWGGAAMTFGTTWYWQPSAWPPLNLKSMDSIARVESGKDRIATGEQMACSDELVSVTCEFTGDAAIGRLALAELLIWRARGTVGVSGPNATDRAVVVYAGMKFVLGPGLFEVVEATPVKLALKCNVMSPSLLWEG